MDYLLDFKTLNINPVGEAREIMEFINQKIASRHSLQKAGIEPEVPAGTLPSNHTSPPECPSPFNISKQSLYTSDVDLHKRSEPVVITLKYLRQNIVTSVWF